MNLINIKNIKLIFILCILIVAISDTNVVNIQRITNHNIPVYDKILVLNTPNNSAIAKPIYYDTAWIRIDAEYKFIKQYLQRPEWKNTPLTADLLIDAAINTYNETNIWVPFELSLSQAQWESGMGTRGKSAKNNPYNVGEYDNGTKIVFNTTYEGVHSYYRLIAKNYLRCKNFDELLQNFTNCQGYRYASYPAYEKILSRQINDIRTQFIQFTTNSNTANCEQTNRIYDI